MRVLQENRLMEIKIQPKTIEHFSKIFSGAKKIHGLLTYADTVTGEKTATQPKKLIPIENHLNRIQYLGRSPVDEETLMVEWIGVDIDIRLKPNDICTKVWKLLGVHYFCFMTLNKKWRVIEFLDEPMHVEEAATRAKELEARIEKDLGYTPDKIATCPTPPTSDSAGRWLFLPYGADHDVCYSPGGLPLSLNQFFFRHKYRNHRMVVAAVGMIGKGEQGSRSKALFDVELYKKHFNCDVTLEEVNENFKEPLSYDKFIKEKRHVEKSACKDTYDVQYYLNGETKWIKEMCGVPPAQDAKGFGAISNAIIDNHVYVQTRKDFYENETRCWLDKEQMNDWWKHEEPKGISNKLLADPAMTKVKGYLTHAGLPEGVIDLQTGDVKGLPAGKYLNIYEPPNIEAVKGDTSKINEYYNWLLGEDNWLIVKQVLAFMLNAREEFEYYKATGKCGLKVQWFVIIHAKIQGAGKKLFAQLCQALFGYKNVAPNVKFSQMTGTHSTIIEGKQLIFLNEVILQKNTAKTKELSNEFKDLITEDNLYINPKNKPQIEIPNLCNFFVFSNSETPLFIENEDRRAFVINLKKSKAEVKNMLENQEYKWAILETIKEPAAFKYHLMNEVKYNREMFFTDAPVTKDKEDLIEQNKDDITAILADRYDNREFPFGDYQETRGTGENQEIEIDYKYFGLSHPVDMYIVMKRAKEFKGTYFTRMDIEIFIKEKATKFPNGEFTKQAKGPDGKRKRLYCTHLEEYPDTPDKFFHNEAQKWIYLKERDWKPNIELSETELYNLYTTGKRYGRNWSAPIELLDKHNKENDDDTPF